MSDRQKIAVLESFRDPEEIFYAEKNSFSNVDGLTQAGAEALADKDLTAAREILDACVDLDIGICTYTIEVVGYERAVSVRQLQGYEMRNTQESGEIESLHSVAI